MPKNASTALGKRSLLIARFAIPAVMLMLTGCAVRDSETGVGERRQADLSTAPRIALWLDSLDLSAVEQSWGSARAGLSVDGAPLTIDGRVFEHGVGTHANSEFTLNLYGQAERFRAFVGVDDEAGDYGTAVFVVYLDDQEAWRSALMKADGPAEAASIDLAGASQMTLVVEDAGDGINYDHADWADARLLMAPGAAEMPSALVLPPGPAPQIAMGEDSFPVIHAPRITGAAPGAPFLFRIPATGAPPLEFSADGLPAELTLDPYTGVITGALATAGTTEVTLTATGPEGQASSMLTIVGGEHKLALTPPMGWNSWNVWGTSVDDAKVRAAADWMVESGLANHGYQYINIDDAWEGERDADGRMQTNEKFPDMKALADYVHAKGLKLGIYSSPGPKTCAGYEGSYQHEFQDAETFAEWGIDLIKYDWCAYREIAVDQSEPELRKPYELMRQALDACGRDIVYSLCQYGMGDVSKWGADVGGNYWRTTGDITDSWPSMSRIGFGQAGLEEYAGPGRWNDPDMLVLGKVGWGPDLRDTNLTPNEQVTHMTLWSLLAAPLLIGCDLSRLDEFTLALLTNPEVLEVNQDPLGRQARRVKAENNLEVWSRPLADGALAVGLFNRGRKEQTLTLRFKDLDLSGPQLLRDLWLREDIGAFNEEYSVSIPRHGAVMLKISPE